MGFVYLNKIEKFSIVVHCGCLRQSLEVQKLHPGLRMITAKAIQHQITKCHFASCNTDTVDKLSLECLCISTHISQHRLHV